MCYYYRVNVFILCSLKNVYDISFLNLHFIPDRVSGPVTRHLVQVMPTLGVDYSAKNIEAPNKETIRLNLWDVAGQPLPVLYPVQARRGTAASPGPTSAAARPLSSSSTPADPRLLRRCKPEM